MFHLVWRVHIYRVVKNICIIFLTIYYRS